MIARNSKGQVIRIFAYGGPMREHGGDREQRTDGALARLDRTAHRRVRYEGSGCRIRKAR